MKTKRLTEEERLISKAVDVLVKELGPAEAGRFLALPRKRRIESVKRHRQWQDQLQQKQFFDSVFGARPSGAVK